MTNRISSFTPIDILSGEIWLEAIHRPGVGAPWQHRRIRPGLLKGKSAYDIAVAHGFVGTEEEWLASLEPKLDFVQLGVGLVTTPRLPVDRYGMALLPSKPYGGFFMDLAHVYYTDGSFIEVTGLSKVVLNGNHYVRLPPEDYELIKGNISGLVVSYLGDLPV